MTSQKRDDTNPYLDNRRDWNNLVSRYATSEKRWRIFAFLCLFLAFGGGAAAVWFAGQPRLLPYVVEVNGKGEPSGVYAAQRMTDQATEQNVLRFLLARYVRGVRGVSPDVNIQRELIQAVYALMSQSYPAYTAVSEWFQENSPLKRAATETVAVQVKQILPVSDKSYRLEWVEIRRSREGALLERRAMTGTVTVLMGGKVSEKNLLLNPTGLYVTHFEWQKQLGQ